MKLPGSGGYRESTLQKLEGLYRQLLSDFTEEIESSSKLFFEDPTADPEKSMVVCAFKDEIRVDGYSITALFTRPREKVGDLSYAVASGKYYLAVSGKTGINIHGLDTMKRIAGFSTKARMRWKKIEDPVIPQFELYDDPGESRAVLSQNAYLASSPSLIHDIGKEFYGMRPK